MAKLVDATFSVYTEVKAFADSEGLSFYASSSMQEATSILQEQVDRLILVQTDVKAETFLFLEYSVFFSFADTSDLNSIRFSELVSSFIETFPKYKAIQVYEASKLKEVPSVFEKAGTCMVVTTVEQAIVSKTNLSMVKFKLQGYLN